MLLAFGITAGFLAFLYGFVRLNNWLDDHGKLAYFWGPVFFVLLWLWVYVTVDLFQELSVWLATWD